MKSNIKLWIFVYCIFELGWQIILEKPVFTNANIYAYLEAYTPRVAIPFAVMFGAWIQQKLKAQKESDIATR